MTSSSANSDPPQRPQIKNDDLEIIDIEDEVFYCKKYFFKKERSKIKFEIHVIRNSKFEIVTLFFTFY